mmetsp:Transcript_101316/g.290690  ORF Transcript_101316/g.290690 Transcript_101316/m.290690 type:complete len:226 (-) Transcript_101316:257-934(-)
MDSAGSANWKTWWPFVYCFEGYQLLEVTPAYPQYAYGVPPAGPRVYPADASQVSFETEFGVNGSSFLSAINLTMAAAKTCATAVGLNYSAIEACADPTIDSNGQMVLGKRGTELEAQTALATVKLNPQHQWTPWVVFEGTPIYWGTDPDDDYPTGGKDLLNWVCAAWLKKGGKHKNLPAGCPNNPAPMPAHLKVAPTDDNATVGSVVRSVVDVSAAHLTGVGCRP